MQFSTSQASSDPVKKVVILGHSYVRRLPFTSPLQLPWFEVRKFDSPGAKVSNITQRSEWMRCMEYRPDIVLLVLGGNDINVDTKPNELSHKIKDLALLIEELTGADCLILSIEPRLQPRDISSGQYNTITRSVNRLLGRMLDSKSRFRGSGLQKEDLGYDGVHLSLEGNQKLFKKLINICKYFWGINDV
ncbi:hypothetical protein Pcinc_007573 [Petrolisthes cinctipes]|uniref:SGNH hydrolase-type esterase domain-containing protein n=1 Tax=Petrolisthes cinctipes TaxID=88211 RepID=A0AAE1G879_PETCI|nr:hypothetical protein Pcinc_007573 [Petrolisthes cinctipes]